MLGVKFVPVVLGPGSCRLNINGTKDSCHQAFDASRQLIKSVEASMHRLKYRQGCEELSAWLFLLELHEPFWTRADCLLKWSRR